MDSALESEVKRLAAHPSRFHEEIGGLVAAIQGAPFLVGRYSVIGCAGDHEGYFVLPPVALWNDQWAEAARELTQPSSVVRLFSSFGYAPA